MDYGLLRNIGVGVAAAAIVATAGCSTAGFQNDVGSASLRIDVAGITAFEISRVVVVTAEGTEVDLARDGNRGDFVGSVLLPAGPTEIIGRAFSTDGALIGESAPVPVNVEAGFVVGATLRILDLTGGQDIDHRPVVMAVTHPLSTLANQPASLAVAAIDPDGDPMVLSWTSDCADATFSDPAAAQTTWIKAAEGSCNISVTASANGLSTTDTFSVVVFDQRAATGAVEINGVFVAAPRLFIDLSHGQKFCQVFPESFDGTCDDDIASPTAANTGVFVEWGNAEPGTLTVTDDCGGSFETFGQDPFFFNANWTPPVNQTVCLVRAEAVSAEGLTSTLSAAIVVRDGEAPRPETPQIFATMSYSSFCELFPGDNSVQCPAMLPGDRALLEVRADWRGATPGSLEIVPECAGDLQVVQEDPFFLLAEWTPLPLQPSCQLTLITNDAQGNQTLSFLDFEVQ